MISKDGADVNKIMCCPLQKPPITSLNMNRGEQEDNW